MPMFIYQCVKCDHKWETLVRKPEEEPETCPECKCPEIDKDPAGFRPSHKYVGRGFYTTDYKKRGK